MRIGQAEVLNGTVLDEQGLAVQAGAVEVEGADQTVGRVEEGGRRRTEQVMGVDHEILASLEENVAVGD
jgi:hypothetical protein